jgi:DNA-binding NarL/FixJ family response regulator
MMLLHHSTARKPLFMPGPSDDLPDDKASKGRSWEIDTALHPRVLIVEDEGLVALNIEGALAEAGFDIVGVLDTEDDAVIAAQRLQPDVVLLDIILREGDGISAARRIRLSVETFIIFLSGNSDPRTLAAADEVGPAAFIRKPFVTETLAKSVADAIRRKGTNRS